MLLFSASSLFALDLSLTVSTSSSVIPAGMHYNNVVFTVHNPGPGVAKDVKVTFASSVPIPDANLGDVPPNVHAAFSIDFVAPATAGPLTITATETSSTPDENTANNTASLTLTVVTGPDVEMLLHAPVRQDLALPFTLDVFVGNFRSVSDAHNVVVTIDFRDDVRIAALPAGCTSPRAGRIVCSAGTVAAGTTELTPRFSIGLVAPEFYGSSAIVFTAVATEDEQDFDPISNTQTAITTLYKTFYVTSTGNDGSGTLRQAILDSNAACTIPVTVCAIAFRITEPSLTPWKTIRVTSPLPAITTPVRVDGATQSALTGAGNANGPDIEISGAGNGAGAGVTVAGCDIELANLAINNFPGNGISVVDVPSGASPCGFSKANLHHLFVGTDPTGVAARPNLRGIATAVPNGTLFVNGPDGFGPGIGIHDCVISGNERSGVFALSGRLTAFHDRIGLAAHSDAALPNGNAGVYVGPGGHGSEIDADAIAFNGQMGVAVDARALYVGVRQDRIWGNGGLPIDVGLDGLGSSITPPVLTAHYDPVAKQTVIEGDVAADAKSTFNPQVDLYASDRPALSGAGEAQRFLTSVVDLGGTLHFRKAIDADLTGQFITATVTRGIYVGFAKPEPNGIDQAFLTTTSEVSRPVEVH